MTTRPKSNKPVRWSDICRGWAMLGLMRNFDKGECLRARREWLEPLLASGRVIRVKRGHYKLKEGWEREGFLLHRTAGGNELRFHP